jgi:hypothetical protein
MNQIKNDYKAFDLQKSMYKSTEESAVRVKHKLCADLGGFLKFCFVYL